MQKAEEHTGQSLLEEPEPPENGLVLWRWFFELHQGRQAGAWGPAPLSWPDMLAWAQLTATPIQPWHVVVLRSMDSAYLRAAHEEGEKKG